ncbi:hypothetical protein BDW67DRAFT_178731 [Aspergillus spinulosporus]
MASTVSNHPVASKFPAATNGISFGHFQDVLRPLIKRCGLPKSADDWTCSDYPALFFEQVDFLDASVILAMYPHHLMDAMGYATFLKSWVAVLHGRETDVLPLVSFSYSPMDALATRTPAERYAWQSHVVRWPGLLWLTIRAFWEAFWGKEERVICVPGRVLDAMRDEALKELGVSDSSASRPAGHDSRLKSEVDKESAQCKNPRFLSESDVLVAWFTRIAASAARQLTTTQLVLHYAFDIRSFCVSSDAASLMNSVCGAYTILPIAKVISRPVSYLAAQLRLALDRERTLEQIEAQCAWAKTAGLLAPVGSANMFHCIVSNWNKGGYFHLDFSPAVVDDPRELDSSPCERLDPEVILGKDSQGNWWMQWVLPAGCWPEIERRLLAINNSLNSFVN